MNFPLSQDDPILVCLILLHPVLLSILTIMFLLALAPGLCLLFRLSSLLVSILGLCCNNPFLSET